MKWITRSHVHVDRVACPWLIKRFIDSEAEFLFVAASEVEGTAAKTGAIPFDIKGAELGHHGDRCTFWALIDRYGLKDPALLNLAEVVNAADTGRPQAHPYASGLEAASRGFSLMFPDDAENLRRQFSLYDALYACLKSEYGK